jgi:hypothetical protein
MSDTAAPYFLIDFENVQPKALERLVPGAARVMVFLGQNQNKLTLDLAQALQPFGSDARYIQIQGSGPDAVDFHIAFYIGEIAATRPGSTFLIISKDKGFDPLIKHLGLRGIEAARLPEIPAPVVQAIAPVAGPKPVKAAPAKAPPAKASAASAKPKPAAALTTKARAKLAISQLKKSTQPTKLTALRASLLSWYQTAWGEKSVSAVLQSLQDSKVVVVSGTKVTYNLS